ncbi:hypothetical protein [Novosphingobium sp.]|uniref:hypothetical protein n=1 Tax=Novosphingobium sp. TaxID=1874826 RepID=UPI0025F03CB8|nr:hypothetical protein [Novosphingobium sp.]
MPSDRTCPVGVIDEKFVRKFSRSFIYAGTAMRSGGRMGVPAETEKLDKQRPHVHDLLLKAYGDDGYRHAQAADLYRIAPRGHNRLVKVFTIVRHIDGMEPATQYPVGGAHLQWTLIKPRDFICGAFVDGDGLAKTPSFTVSIAPGAPQANFFRLERYLEQL